MKLQSPFRICVSPKDNSQYINEEEIGGSKLIINTSIEHAKDVQKIGIVRSLPMHFKGDLQIGDEIVTHHNVFRITYNDKGVPMQSDFHFKDDLFFIEEDMIYLKIRNGEISSYNDNVFVEPIKEEVFLEGEKLVERQGIVRFTSESLKKLGVLPNTKIHFRKHCEAEFRIFGMNLYKMKENRILAIVN